MSEQILKPQFSKMLVLAVAIAVAAFFGVLFSSWSSLEGISDVLLIMLITGVAFVPTLIFVFIFYSLPYFKVIITETEVAGPKGYGFGWQRTEIPIEKINPSKINQRFGWLGFYVIRSDDDEVISLWGFTSKQFERFTGLINKAAN